MPGFIDARGKACPMPVVLAKQQLDKGAVRLQHAQQEGAAAHQQQGDQGDHGRLGQHVVGNAPLKGTYMLFGKDAPHLLHQDKEGTGLDTAAGRPWGGADKHEHD